jgi:hypothetical protein
MKRIVACVAVAIVAAGCRVEAAPPTTPAADDGFGLLVQPLPAPSPFSQITAGPVQAIVPLEWESRRLEGDSISEGFMASPHLDDWMRMDGTVQGMAAVWLDGARGGIPSDYYYLAASGPMLHGITQGEGCRRAYTKVVVDHRPTFGKGGASVGDFVVRGSGTCESASGKASTRWAYFVAAPGVGPVREMGIPNSGLYVVVAVVRDNPDAAQQLRSMLLSATFGDASVEELLAAARLSAQQK